MDISNSPSDKNIYAIRFGLGAIKAVGFNMMLESVREREKNGQYSDIYNFCKRSDAKSINKKSIEALAKSGALDGICKNRRQISESFEILSNYANEAKEEANSNQMNLFAGLSEINSLPALKSTSDWNKKQKLKSEFEAFGFFLNEHPIDDKIKDLKLRGVVFSYKIEEDLLGDNSLIKMAGVVASSKHRSGPRGRFAYLNISDPYGIYEATIFDEALITARRDLLEDGCEIVVECLIKKDDGGTRIMIKNVHPLEIFISETQPSSKEFEDIKKLPARKNSNLNQQNKSVKSENSLNTKPDFLPNNNSFKNLNSKKNEESKISKDSEKFESNKDFFIKNLEIIISDVKAVIPLKTVLLQKKINQIEEGNGAKIYLIIDENNKTTKIELYGKYKLQELDIFRLKNLHPKILVHNVS
ncbi:MAG: hypothetical protein EBT63_02370 [Proteobacteria bacterium]|nr:hypothetical protein [Pseudomonadota bacterium]NCA28850.1 hypothetical protein [Pseudomonadota bacterium]